MKVQLMKLHTANKILLERTKFIQVSIESMEKKQSSMSTDITDLKIGNSSLPCTENGNKIKKLERIVWVVVIMLLTTWFNGVFNSNTKVKLVKAKAPQERMIKGNKDREHTIQDIIILTNGKSGGAYVDEINSED